MNKHDLSNIMRRAWQLYRTTGKAFAVCLSRSWAVFRLIKRMRDNIVSFTYEKADGTLRKAKGTLQGAQALIKGTGIDTPKTVRYFDTDVQAFRSFRVENLIAIM
ncbi:MAG: SH3 beta-barrel fold-containing protein [Rikenellaceae bacterium]|nr:SH3 beta-barrel fold-containing protein [Rikenellaceae bacterium]MDE7355515.1 SH3 beta-barrel fold-containing protein [Rikenellaceae bacterium]